MIRAVPILAFLLSLGACGQSGSDPGVRVEAARVTLPAVPGRPGAAYFTLRSGDGEIRLVGLSSPRIGRVELHETVSVGGISRMVPLNGPSFDPERPLTFAPGRGHAMLFEIDPALKVGDRVPLTFSFDPAPPVTVAAEVRAAGDAGHAGH